MRNSCDGLRERIMRTITKTLVLQLTRTYIDRQGAPDTRSCINNDTKLSTMQHLYKIYIVAIYLTIVLKCSSELKY